MIYNRVPVKSAEWREELDLDEGDAAVVLAWMQAQGART